VHRPSEAEPPFGSAESAPTRAANYPGPVTDSTADDAHAGISIGEEARKLTVYFGERTRLPSGRFAADALLTVFERHGVATSILLRGIEGYGVRHHLRSDQSLSLSEDPPLVAIAVDVPDRIDAVRSDVSGLGLRGLATVERAQLVRGTGTALPAPADPGEAVKLTVYVGRAERAYRVPAFVALCDLMHRRGLSGASVFTGVDGTGGGVRQRARFFDRNVNVPAMVIAVGDGDRVSAMIPELGALLREPLFTVERIRVCKRDGTSLQSPHELPPADAAGLAFWQKMMVYTSESTVHDGAPIHRALIQKLRAGGIVRGATAIRGTWGFHGDHVPHGDSFFQLRRSVPVLTTVIDEPERITQAFDIMDELTAEHGLVTSEMVPALVSAQPERRRGGFRLAERGN
jgi:PII-like signaling protein